LRPEQVSQWINFEQGNPQWRYDASGGHGMAARQVEGVAHLWNRLSHERVALLADEVGTGKTFQALGVAALLWRMAPRAKVLVMAPNRDICLHWQRELKAFVKDHYRTSDGRVKAGDEPVPRVDMRYGLEDLVKAIESRDEGDEAGRLYVTSIHSLSGLVDSDVKGNRAAAAQRAAEAFHRRIKQSLGDRGFDLLIVDEAHYFRNTRGGSQRVAAAAGFFGDPDDSRIAERALLLTATPSHTQLGDVANILGYFLEERQKEDGRDAGELMRIHALRRFRVMAGTKFTKHQYRQEYAMPCDFAGRADAEMFFALYQRRLVHDLRAKEEKRRMLYGFLEGFESAGGDEAIHTAAVGSDDDAEEDHARDFNKATDTDLLRDLSRDFRRIFLRAPEHPKYSRLVAECMPSDLFGAAEPLHEHKHLVFVRRIPSVRELTKRLNERYDRVLARHICDAAGAPEEAFLLWEKQQWSREGLAAITGGRLGRHATEQEEASADPVDGDGDEDGGEEDAATDVANAYLRSRIAELFVAKKPATDTPASGETQATHATRFRLGLVRSTSLHAMFLEPASDYQDGGYEWFFEFEQAGKPRPDYTKAAKLHRMSAHRVFDRKPATFEPAGWGRKAYDSGTLPTLWSLVFRHLDASAQGTLRTWAQQRPDIAENFGEYLKAGLLYASPVIVELYAWQLQFDRTGRDARAGVQERYRAFVAYVRERIEDSLLLRYFASALATFEQLCEKIVGHAPGDWEKGWRTLTTLSSPAWYASGESSHRQHLILGFNSPFYPNTLVATSVFQEGVNLHLNCRKVHHYGIAWTPGDNEQRVGRVDRLFGKVNELLKAGSAERPTLDIHYPYLSGTFDENQVGSFIERKHSVEEKMDRCVQGTFDREIRAARSGWVQFLRSPVPLSEPGARHADPYPARFEEADIPRRPYPGADEVSA
jgi:hypothetical protein